MSGAQVMQSGLRWFGVLLVLAAVAAGALTGVWLFDHYHPDPWAEAGALVTAARGIPG